MTTDTTMKAVRCVKCGKECKSDRDEGYCDLCLHLCCVPGFLDAEHSVLVGIVSRATQYVLNRIQDAK